MGDALAAVAPPRPRPASLALIAALAVGGAASPALALAAVAEPAPELEQPVLEKSARIDYPPELLGEDPPPAGKVVVKLVVGVDGVPKEIELERGVHPRLDELALAAVGELRYRPARYRGQVIEAVIKVVIDIAPPEPEPEPAPEPAPAAGEGDAPIGAGGGLEGGEGPLRVRGTLLEAGHRTPVSGAVILAVPAPEDLPLGAVRKKTYGDDGGAPAWSVRAISGEDGGFELRGLPDGRARIIILTQGYERLDYVEAIERGKLLEVRYYQQRLVDNLYRTVVSTRRNEPDAVDRRSISVEEINNLPGTQGDALKSIQNFPGVARSPFGAGLLVIRGAAPSDSRIYLGYHEIPQLFHFGAITSVFNSDMLAQIDFMPGNFDSRYGDAIGGIVNVAPRKGRRDGFHGYVDADLFDVGVLVEGPVGKGSFAVSGRRSYIDAILKAALPEDIGLNFTQAPRYYDYQGLFDYPVAGGELSVRVFGSDDRLSLITKEANEPESSGDRAGTAVLFHRADLVYRKQEGPWDFLITPAFIYQSASGGFGDLFRFTLDRYELSGRAEIGHQLSRRAGVRLGTEVQVGKYNINAEAPSFPAGSGLGDTDISNIAQDIGDTYASPAVYLTSNIGLGERLTLFPGVRAHYFARVLRKLAVDPRVRFAWAIADRTTIKGGVGMYSQSPDIFEFVKVWGNPRVWLERSVHNSLGVAQEFEESGITLEVTGFYKHVWDRVTGSTALVFADPGIRPENFANQGIGRIYGGELLFRKALTHNLFGWLSYTLMKSEIQDHPGDPWVPFDFDQRHILTAIAVYKLPRNWQVGGRFRLVSGNPTTDRTDGVFDAASGGYLPLDGPRNGDRLPAFHQLDLRVDKRWILRRMLMALYLDVQNVYNRQNGEAWNYSFDYRQRALTTGLPIIPSLGTKIEF
ncbi:MAG: TonB-dependent receptor [Myxococcales bacterium]|nr:TonB-dependent receptor [Myxococcales bacterium]